MMRCLLYGSHTSLLFLHRIIVPNSSLLTAERYSCNDEHESMFGYRIKQLVTDGQSKHKMIGPKELSWRNWMSKNRCGRCYRQYKASIPYKKKIAEKKFIILLEELSSRSFKEYNSVLQVTRGRATRL